MIRKGRVLILTLLSLLLIGPLPRACGQAERDPEVTRLAEEVREKGWIVFCARSEQDDWDLFRCRPDGSELANITRTPEFSETAPQLSRDGTRLLYRRLPLQEQLDNNQHGTQGQLVVARHDASDPQVLGQPGEYSWASWSPDGKQIVCLSIRGVFFVDLEQHKTVRTLPRRGFFQQLVWSPDGKWLTGVSNSFGASWSVGRMDAATGDTNAVSRVDCCTPDWFPDSQSIIFSSRPPGQQANGGYGWTQLWMSDAAGRDRRLIYGEDGRHVYGGHVSPDGQYVLFTGNVAEDGDPGRGGAPMGLMRLADAPIIGGESQALRNCIPRRAAAPCSSCRKAGNRVGRPQNWAPSRELQPVDLRAPFAPRPKLLCVRRCQPRAHGL